jgi:pyruvate-formate lyase-activating enzyme
VLASSQGFGPARNIVAFTGGDLTCRPEFYAACARRIKECTDLWVLIESNGHGLTPANLDVLMDAGVDAFWLDIKASDSERHAWLTGCANQRLLDLPSEILGRGFVLEVLSLYIPSLVEADQLEAIAERLCAADRGIPFTILAFFPEFRMMDFRSPTVEEMVEAYERVRGTGLDNVRLGNLGVFLHSERDQEYLLSRAAEAIT